MSPTSRAGGDLRDVLFNMVSPENCPTDDGGKCTGHPALQDVQVRQALAMAMDKQNIIDVALLGLGSIGVGFVPPGLGDYFIGTDASPAVSTPLARTRCSIRPATPTRTGMASASASPARTAQPAISPSVSTSPMTSTPPRVRRS